MVFNINHTIFIYLFNKREMIFPLVYNKVIYTKWVKKKRKTKKKHKRKKNKLEKKTNRDDGWVQENY